MRPLRASLRRLLEVMVDRPEDLYVDEVRLRGGRGQSRQLFEVELDPDDAGKIIGRQGRTVRALRTLLELRGLKDGRRYGLEIVDS
jgi:predicted RNA-binding protein YlqC (UPF0109 family)